MNTQIKLVNKINSTDIDFIVLAKKDGKTKNSPNASSALPDILKNLITGLVNEQKELLDFKEQTSFVFSNNNKMSKMLFMGTGDIKELNTDKIRMLGGNASRLANLSKHKKPVVFLPDDVVKNSDYLRAFMEGLILGNYSFDEYKSDKSKQFLEVISIFVNEKQINANLKNIIKEATCIGESVIYARDLISRPGNVVNPEKLSEEAKRIAAEKGLTYKVLNEKDMEKLNMNALLSVGKGSLNKPKLIVLEYNGDIKNKEKVAFVGKGITFDSGGISLKPVDGMGEMKDDMGGAAVVLSVLSAAAELQLPVNLIGIIACAENMPSGNAYRPGDIIKAASGKTIEVITTDAEGRLVLADAVWYAGDKMSATAIVDIATLTGAASIALGDFVSGVVTNDQKLCDKVITAGKLSGERCWQMPSFDEFKEYNKSDVADIKNSGGRSAGMITGGLFIGEFTQKPWVHIDIGNTVTAKKTDGYNVKGASGFGVRLLIELARQLKSC